MRINAWYNKNRGTGWQKTLIAVTPHINCETLRMGWTCPNHVRA